MAITRNKHVIDIISDVVDTLRDTAAITNIVDNLNDTYTVSTSNTYDLANGNYITISNTAGFNFSTWLISGLIANTSFVISNQVQKSGIAIPGVFGTWKANAPYYDYELFKKEADLLTLMNKDPDQRFQKFPLIFLLLDISEDRNNSNSPNNIAPLILYFIVNTKETTRAEWKLTNTFKATLIPLMNDFLDALKNDFYSVSPTSIGWDYRYTEKYYYPNNLNQIVDAIEIVFDYKYKVIRGTCGI